MNEDPEPRTRDSLPPLEKAVSDTLDEYMFRLHGMATSWAYPKEFIEWLSERGYIIHAKEQSQVEQQE